MTIVDADAVTASLELAGKRCANPAPLVYARLFAAHPEMEALFVRDTNGAVRGEMLARVFEMVLDFIDRRAYASQMIQCEVVTHEGYGVPPAVFGIFFGVVRDTLRAVSGPEWTPAMDHAWDAMLAEMGWLATHPAQALAQALVEG